MDMEKMQDEMQFDNKMEHRDEREKQGEGQAAEPMEGLLQTMQQMEHQLTEHMDRYITLSDHLCEEVDTRRKKRIGAEYQQKRRQALIKRVLWCVFLLLCCAVVFFLYRTQFDLLV